MLAVALRRRDAREPVTSIAAHLGIGRSTLYRTLAAYDEASATTDTRCIAEQCMLPVPCTADIAASGICHYVGRFD
jgi:hypothetical protein